MVDPGPLTRVLLGLPGVTLRVNWLRDRAMALTVAEAAVVLNALSEQGERAGAAAREALLPVALLLAQLGDCTWVDELRRAADDGNLLSLERMLRRGNAPSPTEVPDAPVPDYGRGRELTVGERRSLARRPNRQMFEKLLFDPHPLVMRQLLENPRLTEDDVVRLLVRRPLRMEVVTELTRTEWLVRARVRMALLQNPYAPLSVTMPLLIVCTRTELANIIENTLAPKVLRCSAVELMERRPPLRALDEGNMMLQ